MITSVLAAAMLLAQAPTGKLHGRVSDASGGAMPGVSIVVTNVNTRAAIAAKTDRTGRFSIDKLPPGDYMVVLTAAGFADAQVRATIVSDKDHAVDIVMAIAMQRDEIVVRAEPFGGAADPAANANATVFKDKDLDALSDDPDELEAQLHALAGPGAGGKSGQIFVDGFTGGKLPPKSAIQEIRINLNPYAAEFDTLGTGRIEIVTKPGSQTLHGRMLLDGNAAALNSRNPFLPDKPDHRYTLAMGTLSGGLSARASFAIAGQFEDRVDTSAIDATVLDASLNPTPLRDSVATPRRLITFNPRIDLQPSATGTLTIRYAANADHEHDIGVGPLTLASQATDVRKTDHDVQVSDNQVFGRALLSETKFEYRRSASTQTALNATPQVTVLGAFVGGGNSAGDVRTVQHHIEFHESLTRSFQSHTVRAGGRLRIDATADSSTRNFNGTFTFPSLAAFQITEQGVQLEWSPAQIRASGGGASQFSIAAGEPAASDTMADVGLFVQDDWRVRSNATVSWGVRVETQTGIPATVDIAPRIGAAWSFGRVAKNNAAPWVVRGGAGVFFDRFQQTLVLQSEHLDGAHTPQFVVSAPDFFPSVPSEASLTASAIPPTPYRIDPHIQVPRTVATGVSIERKLPHSSTLSLGYLYSSGSHQLLSRNVNAPSPDATIVGAPLYEFETRGRFHEHQLTTNFALRPAAWLSLSGFYVVTSARGDTSGPTAFPSNAFDLSVDDGRQSFDIRQRFTAFAGIDLPGFRVVPFIVASSGQPFDITVGRDLNRDSIFNDRPAFATDLSRATVVVTRFGAFDTAPLPAATVIPRNFGEGPAQVTVNLRVMKPFVVHMHDTIRIDAVASNLLNRVNGGTPVGNLGSPFFGQSIGLANPLTAGSNRQVHVQLQFIF